jgi:oligopeptide transport system substrate-binding protein
MWRRQLGINVTLALKEKQVWIADERRLAYDVSLARWIGDYVDPSTFLELFLHDSGNNATGWSNSEYDRLVRAAGGNADPATRLAQYLQAEALLQAATPATPLYHGTHVYLLDPSVRGWEPAVLGFIRYQHVGLE